MEISGLAGASGKATKVAIAGVSTPMKALLRVSLAVPSDSYSSLTTTTR